MKSILTSPIVSLLVGAVLIGVGLDFGGKWSIIMPGMIFVLVGCVLGCVWIAKNQPGN